MNKYCISISRQFGSLGRPVAKLLAEKLDVNFYDRDIVEMAAEKQGIPLHEASRIEESASQFAFMKFPLGLGTTEAQDKLFQVESKLIREIAERESCVIVGRCSDSILEDFDNHLSIFVYAPYEDRIVNCVNELGMDPKHAKKMIADVDKARDAYHMLIKQPNSFQSRCLPAPVPTGITSSILLREAGIRPPGGGEFSLT